MEEAVYDLTGCPKTFVYGELPKEGLLERFKALFRPKTKQFYFTIVYIEELSITMVQDLKGLATVTVKHTKG